MISTIIMIIIISSSSNSGIIFSFYGFVKLLLMQSLHSCFPRAATAPSTTEAISKWFFDEPSACKHKTMLFA